MNRHPGCLTASGLFALVLIASVVWVSHDRPAVDDHGLGKEPVPIRADRNAYPLLLAATNVMPIVPDWVTVWAKEGTNWDDAGAAALVAENAEFFDRLNGALNRDDYQSRALHSFEDGLPGVAAFRNMGRLLKVKSEWHLQRGEKAEATDACIKLVKLGDTIQRGSGSLVEYLVGVVIKTMGMDQALAVGSKLDNPRSILVLNQLLEGYVEGAAGLDSAIACEYRMASGMVDQLARGEWNVFTLVEQADGPSRPPSLSRIPAWLRGVMIRPFLHPNRAKQRFADYYEELIVRRAKPLKEAPGPIMQAFRAEAAAIGKDGALLLLRRNPMGLILSGLLLPALDKVRDRTALLECRTSGVRLALAMRAYYLEKGKWPERLADLTPDFLPALPRDPYDGAPSFRYDPARRMIYVVGLDFTDDGGVEGKDIGWELAD